MVLAWFSTKGGIHMLQFIEDNKGTLLMIGGGALLLGAGYYLGKKKGEAKAGELQKQLQAIQLNNSLSAEDKQVALANILATQTK